MIQFISENLLYVILIIIGIIIISFILKAAFKLVLFVGVIALCLILFFGYTPEQVMDLGTKTTNIVKDKSKDIYTATLKPILDKELENAKYDFSTNGDFIISTNSIKILGKQNEQVVTVIYKDVEYQISAEYIKDLLKEHNAPIEPYE